MTEEQTGEAAVAADGTDIFDSNFLLDLLDGDTELVKEILGDFREDTKDLVSKLKDAFDVKDKELIVRHAHTIKGASLNIGANALSKVSLVVEKAGREGNLELARENYSNIEKEVKRLDAVLRDL